jgi:hypothetical protein
MTPDEAARKLVPLLVDIGVERCIGHETHDLDEKVRDIGRELSDGGFVGDMWEAANIVEDHSVELVVRLDYIWDGVGTWVA